MRKLLILMFVFGLVSSANAAIISFTSVSGPACGHGGDIDVMPGATVTIDIIADTVCTSTYFVSIMESTASAAGDGTSPSVGVWHTNFNANVQSGILRNAMTNNPATAVQRYILIDRASAGQSPSNPIAAGVPLYTFVFTVPGSAVWCDTFTIDAAALSPHISPPPPGYPHTFDGGAVAGTVPLAIHVIPEPATIALLGLGGLLLRRRK